MIVTTYTCDKCGHSQTTKKQMWTLTINLGIDKCPYLYHSALWCRNCVVGVLGDLPQASKTDTPPPPEPPTFEEKIREIVQEEINTS